MRLSWVRFPADPPPYCAPVVTVVEMLSPSRSAFRYSAFRRLVSGIVVALFAVLTLADPLMCPDGCNADELAASQHESSSSRPPANALCLLCSHGINSPVLVNPGAPLVHRASVRSTVTRACAPAHSRRIEHPPRIAA